MSHTGAGAGAGIYPNPHKYTFSAERRRQIAESQIQPDVDRRDLVAKLMVMNKSKPNQQQHDLAKEYFLTPVYHVTDTDRAVLCEYNTSNQWGKSCERCVAMAKSDIITRFMIAMKAVARNVSCTPKYDYTNTELQQFIIRFDHDGYIYNHPQLGQHTTPPVSLLFNTIDAIVNKVNTDQNKYLCVQVRLKFHFY